jgi:hypothetical protein
MDLAADSTGLEPIPSDMTVVDPIEQEQPESDRKLVQKIIKTVKADRLYHEKAFKKMKRWMFIAKYGRTPEYPDESYKANIAGRHVKQKTTALYAKNPKATARRRETLDFMVWDESQDSLKLAFQTIQQAQLIAQQSAAIAAAPPMIDPKTGLPVMPELPPPPPGFEQAQAVIADFQQGMARRQEIQKIGRTLEILYAQAMREQKPVDFKMGMKKMVRRACTTAVGYVELGFQREMGPRPGLTEQLTDARTRLDHLKNLLEQHQAGDLDDDAAEIAELEHSIRALESEPEIVLREGLIVDFPASTRVIPDKLCKSLVGFIGARHLTVEYLFTVDEVKELFGTDLGKNFRSYSPNGKLEDGEEQPDFWDDDERDPVMATGKGDGLVCVWKHYDKPSGLVYYVADGHQEFLRPPASPDVFVEDFWPVYALTFNDVENEDELFPPSDVELLLDMQMEHNRSRQGKREHRRAARPRWGYPNGALDDEDITKLKTMEPFEAIGFNVDPQTKLNEVLQPLQVPGVDPNLYDTGEISNDMQMVVGTQEALMGGISKATATESAISANSSASSDSSSVDDLDSFLTVVSRASGQILLKEMSEEQVKRVAGPGAVWPHMTLAEIADEIFLEVEAGSTGKPNQAIEINNWKTLAPFIMQMPSLNKEWFLKETLRRLDDKMDLTDAIMSGVPSIVAQNSMQQPGTGDPASDPGAQGPVGGANAPAPPGGEGGTDAHFGSNQV